MSLSPAEHYHLHGTLTPAHIEPLLDASAQLAQARAGAAHINEAMAQYPGEDFLQQHLEQLQQLVGHMRGPNRDTLVLIIANLQTQIDSIANDAAYGRDELSKALDAMEVWS
jgi:hypothetical protein